MSRKVPRLLPYLEKACPSLFGAVENGKRLSRPEMRSLSFRDFTREAKMKLGFVAEWAKMHQSIIKFRVLFVGSDIISKHMVETEKSERLNNELEEVIYDGYYLKEKLISLNTFLKTELVAFNEEYSAIKDELVGLEEKELVLKEDLDALKKRIDALHKDYAALSKKGEALKEELDAFDRRLEAVLWEMILFWKK